MGLIERIFYNLTQVHPLHAMIVHFPIGLTGAASFFILLALFWRKNSSLETIAFANIALASAATVVAGITGWLDNLNIWSGAAPNANVKIILGATLFLITGLVSFARWRNPNLFDSGGRVLYVAGIFLSFVLALTLSFLGGVILYGF